jgi:hypothetical protein
MKKMTYTTIENHRAVRKTVCFLSAFYMPGDGVKALVVGEDNKTHEVNPADLSLPVDEYNKIFAE